MKKLIEYIELTYSQKNVAHIYSIILRADYEQKKHDKPFILKQIENLIIKYDGDFYITLDEIKENYNKDKMKKLVKYIYSYFKKEYPIDYDYRLIDPIYFSLFFYDLLDKIVAVKMDTINIKNIKLLRHNSKPVKLEESERYKALLNKNHKMYSPFPSNSVNETPEERLNNMLKSIKKRGYGYENKVAIFYNDEPYIRDGQHRVSVLKYLNGDIDIKIVRFYLKDNYFYD